MNTNFHSRRGQTLVEALVALSILTVGLMGVATLLTKSFQLNRITTNDTQATYLAAEGIEIAKNLIDHDVYAALAGHGTGFGTCFSLSGDYYPIDFTTSNCSVLVPSAGPPNTKLYFDPVTKFFTTTAGGATPTNFVRNVKITNITNANGTIVEIDVQSTVKWASGLSSNSVTLEDHFYNWHP